jgi:hypothetical protein
MVDPTSPMAALQYAMRNPKFANAPTTMGIPIEEMNKKDIDPTSPRLHYKMLCVILSLL